MASTLDISCVYHGWIDFDNPEIKEFMKKEDVFLDIIYCMDNWMWENYRKIEMENMRKELNNNKIIIVKFKTQKFSDMGMYIQKENEDMVCDFWINTEKYPELDIGVINQENEKHYLCIYQILHKITDMFSLEIKILGIGVELTFEYYTDVAEIIRNSYNATAWLVNKKQQGITIDNFCKRRSGMASIILFEKREKYK